MVFTGQKSEYFSFSGGGVKLIHVVPHFHYRCNEDFLEIRDGPSDSSPLVGRFCRDEAPSTVVSTGEHLHVRYVTGSGSS